MPFEVFTTTAEDVIGATDAVLQVKTGADENLVASFLDIPVDNARNALLMAEQLGLIQASNNGLYVPICPYAVYLVTGIIQQKAAILRLMLEQYDPYRVFKFRLEITNSVQEAANHVKALFNFQAHRGEIISTFISLGTYTNSLIAEGAGRYRISEGEVIPYFSIINDVVRERETAEAHVRRQLGNTSSNWINYQEVLTPLVTAYQRAATADVDPRAPILYAGNAIESFLDQLARNYGINLTGANGINAKAERISQAHRLVEKHKYIIKYLGHVRNATDHGIDQEIGQAWNVSRNTAIIYVHVAFSIISDILESVVNNNFVV